MNETLENRLNLWKIVLLVEDQRENPKYFAYSGMTPDEARDAFERRFGYQPEEVDDIGLVILCGPVTG